MTNFENGMYGVMYYNGLVAVTDVVRRGRTAFCTVTTRDGRRRRAEIVKCLGHQDEILTFIGRDGLLYFVSSRDRKKEV